MIGEEQEEEQGSDESAEYKKFGLEDNWDSHNFDENGNIIDPKIFHSPAAAIVVDNFGNRGGVLKLEYIDAGDLNNLLSGKYVFLRGGGEIGDIKSVYFKTRFDRRLRVKFWAPYLQEEILPEAYPYTRINDENI